jgi:hypothetical protein
MSITDAVALSPLVIVLLIVIADLLIDKKD